jgi:hypothetical protein
LVQSLRLRESAASIAADAVQQEQRQSQRARSWLQLPVLYHERGHGKALPGRTKQPDLRPNIQRMDMSAFKRLRTLEAQYLELRADCFNVLNTPIYGTPSSTAIGQSGGQITGARQLQLYTPNSRFFQLSAKYVF